MKFDRKKWLHIRTIKASVGKKMILGFCSVLLLLITVSSVSISEMNKMGGKAQDIKNKWMPSVEILGAMQADLINGQRLAVMLILEPDAQAMNQLETRLQEMIDDLKQKQAEYERSLISGTEERSLYESLLKSENEYFSKLPVTYEQKTKLLNLGRANGAHDLTQEMGSSLQQALDILAKAILLNRNGSEDAVNASVQLYEINSRLSVVLTILAVLLGMGIAWLISRNISRPLTMMAKSAKRIASGDLTEVQFQVKNRDEVGDLAGAFQEMAGNLRSLIRQAGFSAEQVAVSSEQLTAGTEQVTKATEQIAFTVQGVAAGAEKQVCSVADGIKEVNEMSSEINKIAENAQRVYIDTNYAQEMALEGNQGIQLAIHQMNSIHDTVHELSTAVKGLGERSQEIGHIVGVIADIASRTNLLSLNASIEAARAGVHGRGFAVVANEVRKLAEQSAQAAKQISQLSAAIQDRTAAVVQSMEEGKTKATEGISVVNQTGQSFERIKRSVDQVVDQIQEVSTAARQMTVRIEQIADSVNAVSAIANDTSSGAQDVSAAAEQQLASMEEIAASASGLSKLSGELQSLICKFKV